MPRINKILLALVCLLLNTPALAGEPPIKVAVSIKPIHSLVAGIMAGVAQPSLIVEGSRSPHSYNLKPSGARRLGRADVIIWVGPGMEMFLRKTIAAVSDKARVITLHEGTSGDPHLWLSPVQAASIIDKILPVLTELDPPHADTYTKNAKALRQRLVALQSRGMEKLGSLGDIPFVVFHDAWSHFAKAFGLSITGAVAVNPERPPGAKRIATIRRMILDSGVRCLFKEAQFSSPLIATVLEGHPNIKVFELDPLGSALRRGPELYFKMMQNNINAVNTCLQ